MIIKVILLVVVLLLVAVGISFVFVEAGVDKISFKGIEISAQDYNAIQEQFGDKRNVIVCNMEKDKCLILTKLPND